MRSAFFMLLAGLLLLACVARCQSPKLDNWAGAGAVYSESDTPHFTGWAALAVPVSTAAQAYSFTLYQALPVKGKTPTISTTTGLATILKSYRRLYLLGIATVGAATTSTAATGAFAGGGFLVYRFKALRWYTAEIGAIQNKAGGAAKPDVLAGLGVTW
jgi:hypothetical protein